MQSWDSVCSTEKILEWSDVSIKPFATWSGAFSFLSFILRRPPQYLGNKWASRSSDIFSSLFPSHFFNRIKFFSLRMLLSFLSLVARVNVTNFQWIMLNLSWHWPENYESNKWKKHLAFILPSSKSLELSRVKVARHLKALSFSSWALNLN